VYRSKVAGGCSYISTPPYVLMARGQLYRYLATIHVSVPLQGQFHELSRNICTFTSFPTSSFRILFILIDMRMPNYNKQLRLVSVQLVNITSNKHLLNISELLS